MQVRYMWSVLRATGDVVYPKRYVKISTGLARTKVLSDKFDSKEEAIKALQDFYAGSRFEGCMLVEVYSSY